MKPRTLTLASFFSVAMAATLMGALYTTQAHRPAASPAAEAATAAAVGQAPRNPAGTATLGFDTFRAIAHDSNAGVVNINTSKVVRLPRYRNPFHDFGGGDGLLDRFFGQGPDAETGREQRRTQTSLGSGFVIDKDGLILTNRHVIEGADEVSVSFPDGKHYDAKIVGQDARTDVALIKIEPRAPLTPLPLGDSDQLEPGEWVMAVGNPFGLGGNSVTVGVVSFVGRDIRLQDPRVGTSVQMIQTDAAINPGNSGGPLLNTRGEVVGINTMIVTGGSQASAGVGFSVPINAAKGILPQLREKGKVTRGWMGVTINSMTEDLAATYGLKDAKGAVVSSVQAASPAEKAGVQPEDVVLSVDGRPIQDNGDLSRYIASKAPGATVKIELLHGKQRRTVDVTLGTFPDEQNDAATQPGNRSRLGMTLRDLSPAMAERLDLPRGTRGVVVTDVEAGEAAEEAGLARGDVVLSVNGQGVDGTAAFDRVVEQARPDGRVRLRVLRQGDYLIVVLRLK